MSPWFLLALPLAALAAAQGVMAGRQAGRGAPKSAVLLLAGGGVVSLVFAVVLCWVISRVV